MIHLGLYFKQSKDDDSSGSFKTKELWYLSSK
ncbi:putative protein [Arabidopsis thaliana]|uniref:Uncharacterized protein At5g02690 n=1 Tax=Arabidopsis thaliana TaxID=3702 RepID=Q9LZ33_ARATH|nr:hypothetical protein [Arabidopsis thaliana]CAB86006.1 putative protein [Arabidopsis thaliana]